ncbi:chromosome condensation regulator, partial [Paenibacillus ehimensis]
MDCISPKEAALKVKRWPKATIAAGYRHTVGLKSDGTVTAVGDNKYGQCDVSGWRDMVAVAAGNAHTGNAHTIGLKSDGTVVAVGWNKHDQCDVSG